MSTVKKGITVVATQMWKHLRPENKRRFWRRQRADDKRMAKHE